jgi:beta-mannosidase
MRRFQLFLWLFILPFTGYLQDINWVDLGGVWKFRKQADINWLDGEVPGSIHLDLMRNHLIDDPFYRDNETRMQWIGETGWEYRREFTMTSKDLAFRHIELVCKGLDTYANVFLNDSLVIVADNMFRTWYSNIRRFLRTGTNVIRIEFPSIVKENKLRYDRMSLKFPGDEKVVCRKAAYHFGWDWGPALITCGVWRPIYIRLWDDVNVIGVQYIQKKLTDTLALVSAELTINSVVKDSVRFNIYLDSVLVISENVILGKKGVTVFRKDFAIRNPRKWWPNGMGNPDTYQVNHLVTRYGKVVGKGQQRIGLRTIELVQKRDSIGKSFYFEVNGVPVFIKGANYIPQDNFEIGRASCRERV